MTIITKLSAKGFKSFAKNVEIPFNNGFNCIMGPNGSGKSNVVDAIVFVLGESSARNMRAGKSANLIYNGGKKGTPSKEAEVSIYFDNADKTFPIDAREVIVTRVVKQSGNSVYKINNEIHTRQQVVDLLSAARIDADGHNIVLQGDITQFTKMKSEDRRLIVEEISGISVYEDKKSKAMGDLGNVQEKLDQADIILAEREKTLKELKNDRDQASEFKKLEENLIRNKATRQNILLEEKKTKYSEAEAKQNTVKNDVEKLQSEINLSKQEIDQKRQELTSIATELNEKGDSKQRLLQKEIESLKTELFKKISRKDVVENEIRRSNDRKKELSSSLKGYEDQLLRLRKEREKTAESSKKNLERIDELRAKSDNFKEKHGLKTAEDANSRIITIDGQIEEKQRFLQTVLETKQEHIREKDKAGFEIESIDSRLGSATTDKELVGKLKNLKEELKIVTRKLADNLNENSMFASQLNNARKQTMELSEELSRLRMRNANIREINSTDRATQKIMSMSMEGVYGTVSSLGNVSSKYSMALKSAAGNRINSIVVSTDAIAAKCIQTLKDSKSGFATFLPLNKMQDRPIEEEAKKISKMPGAHGLALDLVTYDSKFKTIFKFVFGATVVVDNVETARKVGIGRARMITLDGDMIEPSGAMTGGFRDKLATKGFKEKELDSGIENLEEELAAAEKKIDLIEKNKTENEDAIMSLRERKVALDTEIILLEGNSNSQDAGELRKQRAEITARLQEHESLLSEIEADISKAEREVKELRDERSKLLEALGKTNNTSFADTLQKYANDIAAFNQEILKNDGNINSIDRTIEMNNTEKNKTLAIIANLEKDLNDFSTELAQLSEFVSTMKQQQNEKESMLKQFYTDYASLFKRQQKAKERIEAIERSLILNEERIRTTEGKKNEFTIKMAELAGELAGLEKEFEQYANVQLRRGVSLQELNSEINKYEVSIKAMGNVNLKALEVYERVHDEYGVLVEKYEKLKLEKNDVLNMISVIDGQKKDIFMKFFNHLNKNFKEIFATLSTKGEATLTLDNPEDPFAGGVDVKVRLGGARYLDTNLLSGGEKTLAALAFVFAIQEFEPASFYLLDEPDAALDLRNSELLSKLISKYSDKAQYIVISHNTSIINDAETIYGVSMQDGISKVISVKV